MRFNPATESTTRLLDELAVETKAVIVKLSPPRPRDIVWDPTEGRWVDNSHAVHQWCLERHLASELTT